MAPLYVLVGGLLLICCLHIPSCSATQANGDTLAAGQALSASDKLVSRNDKFALGFFQFQPAPTAIISKSTDTTITSLGWYLGIWFNKIPVFTPVWVANREKPISAPDLKLTQLKISRDGNLAIIISNNATTESIFWSTNHFSNRSSETNTKSTSVILMNTGNLALVAESPSNGVPLWQSFDYPTDVGIPGAKIGRNKVTGFKWQFISRKSMIDPGLGSYNLEIDSNGVMLLGRRNPPFAVYWSWPPGILVDKLITVLNGLLDSDPRTKGLFKPSYVNNKDEEYFTYTSLNESSSSFASINTSGQVNLHVWSQANQSWEIIYSQPSDICTTFAVCGPFTVCNDKSSPSCDCMETFSLKSSQDWNLGDWTGGCVRNTPLDCTTNRNTTSSTDVFHVIPRVTLPYDPRSIEDAITQSECAEACLNDCSCTAYSFKNSRCSIWLGDLLNLNQDYASAITSEDVLYLRLATKDLPSLKQSDKRKPRVVTAASIVSFVLLMLVLLLVIWSKKFKWCGVPLHGIQGSGGGIVAFRYTDLSRATKNFTERLGGGGFGTVFKGVLGDKIIIAAKRLDGVRQGEKQFRAEVGSIGLIQHINIVKLIGFCCEGDNRILVYEHMSNGSLDVHLFQSSNTVLNWSIRYQIAIGVARGLSYLHQCCRECIIHCDIKPENILLDASFLPKIADFGMAAIIGRDFSRVLTTFRGTAGYLAPEWLSGDSITPKVDVYSFGMVLLEIISGKRNSPEVYSTSTPHHITYFPVQAISQLHEGDVQSLVDPQLQGDFGLEEVERVFKVAFWCIQDNESDRPTMVEVVRALEGLQEFNMPPMPRLLAAITRPSNVAPM